MTIPDLVFDARVGEAACRFIVAGIRAERVRRGLSQADVATRMGVKPAAVSRWESGTRDLRLSTFLRYLEAVFGS